LQAARQVIDRCSRGNASQEERKIAEDQEREAKQQIDLLVGNTGGKNQTTEFAFYPYRYFAAEGFLPGYNFPRLPVRAFIPARDKGEFVSRPRALALREFAPGNIIYYEGSKYQIQKTKIPVGGIESKYQRISVCFNCGYLHQGDFRNNCENCGTEIKSDSANNAAKLSRVLEMETMLTRRRERITCDEEERLKHGYNLTTHFRFAPNKQESAIVEAADGTPLLRLTYGETATVWRINRGLKRSQEKGFKLNIKTGQWGETIQKSSPKTVNDSTQPVTDDLHSDVHLMVKDTSNVLLIQPLSTSEQSETFLITLQYALEAAIREVYKLEEDELDSERLGENKYYLFWEASEGGAGVLSQLLKSPTSFQRVAELALDICHFQAGQDLKPDCVNACYQCLLTYRNQFDHPSIERHLLKGTLESLLSSQVKPGQVVGERASKYEELRSKTDPNSSFERVVLDAIYNKGLKLPDSTQELIPEANIKPDFIYHTAKIAIFCDGSVHDNPEQQQRDRITRDNLRYHTNYSVVELHYDEDWQEKLVGYLG
jgi:hypothetical protein